MDRNRIGYYASHEQFGPGELLEHVKAAETAGFHSVLSSEHFHPWSERQGESGFAWSWLGAAMHATEKMPFGIITAPGYRYHPAIVAHAAATLAVIFPGRFWVSIGSGELLNEGIIGERWPGRGERNDRLLQCAGVMRDLWAGETVTRDGAVRVERARLYTRPSEPPLLLAAANACSTAEWVGGWADGLITLAKPLCRLAEIIDLFRRGGGEGKPVYLKLDVAYGRDGEEAIRGAHDQWRNMMLGGGLITELRTPREFDAAGGFVRDEDLQEKILISADLDRHIERLQEFLDLGIDRIYLHNVTKDQTAFIEDFGREVLPAVGR
ncbi:MAG: LLM class F420-dependent oxidoreductase [Methanomicrobiales archaeon HGW-Methanomicrobiales-6]|jgi:probable non-F420 flavinoid oxidoreductase|nr:MAG: LLM class F420-dependent oxidoreductase [Methanomicrobiales archaeon HGW-Methanomicrobiales-6]